MKHTPMKALVSTALVLVLGSPLAVERVHAAAIPDEVGIMATELLAEQASGDIVVVTETDGVPSFKVVKNIDSVSEAETAIEGAVQATGPGTVLTDADWQETATLTAAVTGPLPQWPVTTLGLEQAWSASTGSGVVVAVVDSGVAAHPDIPNLLPGFSSVDGIITAGQTDSVGHGTHVAGIIGAGNDGIGITGVAHGASILPIKAFAGTTAPASDVAVGIVKAVEAGAHVISMSFGFASENAALTAAIDFAVERGVVLVAASGNGSETGAKWPAADPRVLAVGAIQENGTLWSLSITGPELDLVAPGRNVISTVVASSKFRGWGGITDGTFSYGYASGTSMATPHVAGVAALVLARHPEATRAQVMSFLTSTASDKGDAGFDVSYGYGLVNPTAALAASDTVYGTPPSAPGAPTSIVTDAGNSSIRLTWNAPVNDGGATITDYEIKYSSNSGSSWTPFPHDASNMTNATVTGLVNGTGYSFRVSAVNAAGTGSPSNVTPTVTPIAAPGAPSGLDAVAGANNVRLSWNAADANGSPVTDYVIEYSSNSGASWTVFTDGVSTATNATVTGLTSGTRYSFRVSAVNAAGQGSAGAQVSATPIAASTPTTIPVDLTPNNGGSSGGDSSSGGTPAPGNDNTPSNGDNTPSNGDNTNQSPVSGGESPSNGAEPAAPEEPESAPVTTKKPTPVAEPVASILGGVTLRLSDTNVVANVGESTAAVRFELQADGVVVAAGATKELVHVGGALVTGVRVYRLVPYNKAGEAGTPVNVSIKVYAPAAPKLTWMVKLKNRLTGTATVPAGKNILVVYKDGKEINRMLVDGGRKGKKLSFVLPYKRGVYQARLIGTYGASAVSSGRRL